eukprot:SAG31_NODE_616_length_13519_cov_2.372876_2_plen_109_part_00
MPSISARMNRAPQSSSPHELMFGQDAGTYFSIFWSESLSVLALSESIALVVEERNSRARTNETATGAARPGATRHQQWLNEDAAVAAIQSGQLQVCARLKGVAVQCGA